MPVLLLREGSATFLSSLVEKAQKKSSHLLEYDLQLNNSHLDLILLSKPDRPINATSPDEGFESDIDSLSIVSSDNDSFTIEKLAENENKPNTETDSANGSSSSDSDTETTDVRPPEPVEVQQPIPFKRETVAEKESFNLVDCVCYTDVKCTDILIFVIKTEALVFKFENIGHLKNFYTNFTTLKAVANQKAYGKNLSTRFNLLQRTDQNGITHIEITREAQNRALKDEGPTSIISINSPDGVDGLEKFSKNNKSKDVNSRQRVESQLINDIKYNTINSKLGPKAKIVTKSNSIENILHLDDNKSYLVNEEGKLKKVWNSADDLLDAPKRPQRRKKGKAPQPPVQKEKHDVFSGQFVRVSVNFDPVKNLDKNRLIIKSSLNEPHPKKLQNFNILGKPSLSSILRPKERQILKYEPKKLDTVLTKNKVLDNWTNSMPRLLKKPRSKSETRNFIPMAYRYIDTTQDYPLSYTSNLVERGDAHFSTHSQNISLSHYLRGENSVQNINNRLFGLSPKLKDFSEEGVDKVDGKWGVSDKSVIVNKDNNLKSVIKNNRDDSSKKKNDKKVTFSAYTTVQVV